MLLLAFIAILFFSKTQADNGQGAFITPSPFAAIHDYSDDPTYQIGQPLTIQWNVSWQSVNLHLWQNDNPIAETLLLNQLNTGSLDWHIKTDKDYSAQSGTNGTVFFFQLVQADQQTSAIQSHYFNISGPAIISVSSSPSSSSTTSSSSFSSSSYTTTATITTDPSAASFTASATTFTATHDITKPTTSPLPPSSSSLSSLLSSSSSPPITITPSNNTLAAGLGVGVGLAAAGFIGTLTFVLARRRRTRRQELGPDRSGRRQGPEPSRIVPAYELCNGAATCSSQHPSQQEFVEAAGTYQDPKRALL